MKNITIIQKCLEPQKFHSCKFYNKKNVTNEINFVTVELIGRLKSGKIRFETKIQAGRWLCGVIDLFLFLKKFDLPGRHFTVGAICSSHNFPISTQVNDDWEKFWIQ